MLIDQVPKPPEEMTSRKMAREWLVTARLRGRPATSEVLTLGLIKLEWKKFSPAVAWVATLSVSLPEGDEVG